MEKLISFGGVRGSLSLIMVTSRSSLSDDSTSITSRGTRTDQRHLSTSVVVPSVSIQSAVTYAQQLFEHVKYKCLKYGQQVSSTSVQNQDITTNMSTCNQQIHNLHVVGQYAR